MTAVPQPRTMTLDEFLAWEAKQETRHEFVDGEIFAMTGGTLFHAIISGNLYKLLTSQLDTCGCLTVYETQVLAGDKVFYPDIVTTCDPNAADRPLIEQPTLIVEVLSPSTESYDRGIKCTLYQQLLPTLRSYLLVSQDSLRVDVFRRTTSGWHLSSHTGPDAMIELAEPACRLPLSAIYQGLLTRLPT
jgi:Uma2 family endonuclease